tara:strand:- start:1840 stop:2412 length:573 start_codon:yes stop_codon:yes gene_type:complete
MIEIIHRVNHIDELNEISNKYGIEVDIRGFKKKLILAHDLHEKGDNFKEYIDSYEHKLLVANIKESGIEEQVIGELSKKNISNFFLLDVEFPYILQNFEKHGENLCLRFSKHEGIDTIKNFIGKVKWIWVDTYEDFDLDSKIAAVLSNFSLCLVSPSRWGFNNQTNHYINKFESFDLSFDAIMIDRDEAS